MILSPRRLTPTVHCTGVLCWQQSVGSQTNSQIFPTSSWLSDASLVISRCQLRALSSCAGCRHTSNCISINHQGWSLCISSVNRKEKSPAHNQWQMTQNLRRAFFNIINSDNVEIIRSFSIGERLAPFNSSSLSLSVGVELFNLSKSHTFNHMRVFNLLGPGPASPPCSREI